MGKALPRGHDTSVSMHGKFKKMTKLKGGSCISVAPDLNESTCNVDPLAAMPNTSVESWVWWRMPAVIAVCVLANLVGIHQAFAHGFAGKRFFPATLATDDPFVADELSLPTISSRKTAASGDEPATRETAASVDFTKRITPDFVVGLGASYLRLQPDGASSRNGFDNLSANLKYQFYKSDERETILSVGPCLA